MQPPVSTATIDIAMQQNTIKLDKIPYDGDPLIFNSPFYITPILDKDNGYVVEIKELNLFTCAETLDELKFDLLREFAWLWKTYALETDENLTDGAQEIKKYLLQNMRALS